MVRGNLAKIILAIFALLSMAVFGFYAQNVYATRDSVKLAYEYYDSGTTVTVSGAGSSDYNGQYTVSGSFGGKPAYSLDANHWLWWYPLTTCWFLSPGPGSMPPGYRSMSSPDLPANPWSAVNFGILPAPTLTSDPIPQPPDPEPEPVPTPVNPDGSTNNQTGTTSGGTNQTGQNQTGATTADPGAATTTEKIATYVAEGILNTASVANLTAREMAKTVMPTVLIVTAATLTVVSALASIFSTILTQVSLKELLLIFFNYIVSLLNLKKRNKFGLVYDQVSDRSIPAAIVRIFEFKTMKMIDSTLTDMKGHFFFTVNPGEYVVTVIKTGFVFPSRSVSKSEKFIGGAYIGQTIHILKDASVINVKIPLDRIVKAKIGGSIFVNLLLSNLIRYLVLVAGSAVTLYILYQDYSRMYFSLACLYLLLWIIELIIHDRDLRFNKVIDKTSKRPINLATIRIFATNGRLVQTSVSDFKGRFIVKTRESGDQINIERVGYQTLEQKTHEAGILEGKRFYLDKA